MGIRFKNISILGCGWLGLPLAQELTAKDYIVKGSTTTSDKLAILSENEITPFLISLTEKQVMGDIIPFLESADVLLIDIPPKLRGNSTENFVSKIRYLIPHIENAKVSKVLFVSSTSVYGDAQERVDESAIPVPDTEGGKQLLEVEQLLLANPNFKSIIVRFGGLIGPNRNPVRFLAGKENLENPETPINMTHQEDAIIVLETLLKSDLWGEVFNVVAPFHPTRKDYYTAKAIEFGLPIPKFVTDRESSKKWIVSDKIIHSLPYTFKKENYE